MGTCWTNYYVEKWSGVYDYKYVPPFSFRNFSSYPGNCGRNENIFLFHYCDMGAERRNFFTDQSSFDDLN